MVLASTVPLTHSCVAAWPDKRHQFKNSEFVKDIRHCLFINFLLFNSDKTEALVIGPAGSFLITSAAKKDFGVILDSFDVYVDNITKIAFFSLRNIARIKIIRSVQKN